MVADVTLPVLRVECAKMSELKQEKGREVDYCSGGLDGNN